MAMRMPKAPKPIDPVVKKWLEMNAGRWTLEEAQDALEIASALRGRRIVVPGVPARKKKRIPRASGDEPSRG
jgi:sugar phosphate isomerase/epimerase